MNVRATRGVALTALVSGWLAISASAQAPRFPWPMEPIGNADEAIFPAYEGWGESRDGSGYYILLGYKNRNRSQTLEIPVGPNNKIEPGGPDYGQPTVFLPGRQKTVFAIKVPKDFGKKKLTWTLVANGQPAVVSFYLNPEYNMAFYREEANRNDAPKLKLGEDDPMMVGPSVGFAKTITGKVGQPVPLTVWASDPPPEERNWEREISLQQRRQLPFEKTQVAVVDGRVIGPRQAASQPAVLPDITVVWTKLRGPGEVTFAAPKIPLSTGGDGNKVVEANTTATFSAPGEYVLRVEPVEVDDGFDGLCCFTYANVKVVVN